MTAAKGPRLRPRIANLEECILYYETRCHTLEVRDAERAKEIIKTRVFLRAAEKAMLEERRLRVAADDNTKRMHALLIQERVLKIGGHNDRKATP